MFDVHHWRAQFPALEQNVHGHPLAYLDNGASTQKPQCVLDAMMRFYQHDYSNVHRGVHTLSARATEQCERVRDQVKAFINAAHREEIILTAGTTAAINLVAHSYGQHAMQAGDEVIITATEHHANIVPWQMLRDRLGIVIKVLPLSDQHAQGDVCWDQLPDLITARTKLLAISHVSNVLGTIYPVKQAVAVAHARGVPVLVDGAQAVPHLRVDVQDLDCDFYAFSSHKMYGPTGVGVLYGRRTLLEAMPPYQGGGDMIAAVRFDRTTYNVLPYRFEAGTPPIAEIVGLGAAITFLESVGLENIAAHEQTLLKHTMKGLSAMPDCEVYGQAPHKAAVIAFALSGVHAHDVATVLDTEGVAVRAGHHCAMPLMEILGVSATTRASFALYNTLGDVAQFLKGLQTVQEVFSHVRS